MAEVPRLKKELRIAGEGLVEAIHGLKLMLNDVRPETTNSGEWMCCGIPTESAHSMRCPVAMAQLRLERAEESQKTLSDYSNPHLDDQTE